MSVVAQSDQAGENDGVYKAIIKYIAHLGRRAKRKLIVMYTQWREKKNAAKKACALMEEAMMQQEEVEKQIQMERDSESKPNNDNVKKGPKKQKKKKRKKRRKIRKVDEPPSLSEITSVGTTVVRKQSLPLPPNASHLMAMRRMSCLSPMINISSPVPPKASPELSEIESPYPFRPSAQTISSESVFIHPTPSVFSPPRNRSRESSASYYTAIEEPTGILPTNNHRRDTQENPVGLPPPIVWDNASGSYLVLQTKAMAPRGLNRLDSSKTTTSDNNKVGNKRFRKSLKNDENSDKERDSDSKDKVSKLH